ncbi:MAG: hypothetical protein EYC70_05615 [Planctomycetota bacterium]|nr:MAG: hypothetical protein EYC70_05615 [Planctomycetota bacterium]
MLILPLPLFLSVSACPQAPALPATPEAFAAAVGARKAWLGRAPGLEVWSDEDEGFKEVDEPARKAWTMASEWIGGPLLPEDQVARVLVLHGEERLQAYFPLFVAECQRRHVPAPGADFVQGVVRSGSGLWSNPPAVWINGQILHKDDLATRVVHDLGAIAARFLTSPYGNQPPECLEEGFAGMLMRHALKKPTGLVSHQGAAQASTLHGYGVFAGIGAASNDYSNHPASWPGILKQAVQKMRKEKELEPKSRVDQLLLRNESEWARADYAYAWAVIEFLFDPLEPYGGVAADPKFKRGATPLAESRRSVTVAVLEQLREEFGGADAPARAARMRELVLERSGETPEQLHAAFMRWVEAAMPKK